jgi:DNA-binding GntR family transcriptional regulator
MANGDGPRYQSVAAELRARVARGTYASGEPLPSQPKLAKELGVSLATLRQA